jgi:hypothetical protein
LSEEQISVFGAGKYVSAGYNQSSEPTFLGACGRTKLQAIF